ncbi:hypothetical protein M441DRAFT_447358 [Trichoderma asperellum CBS 433.97]|uniref:Transcription factor domain-containing protein n=1 Tax=Trichoderma asperellum (strain ATCC 204424 / CBS 433.97 / NBRC 101777) TaxID=1042311 RepID=A0A2T3Z0X8_TRIA4|nr:hypothetical protein M441DRAFT_447358 [Trichoderma asperellum CBS 433.97]PTB38467.1 hypothetical protein M441DRAFT_447358 [Trichoderma asperellum CBS 433.97]
MSQAKPYREFKFVESGSRKRRRRTRSKPSAKPTSQADAENHVGCSDALQSPTAPCMTYQQGHAKPVDIPSPMEPRPDEINVSRILSPLDDAVLSGIYHAVDETFGDDLFNPFFDSGISPTSSGDQLGNFPFYFGPDITICEIDESSLALDTSTAQNREPADDHEPSDVAKETDFDVNAYQATQNIDTSWINSNIGSNSLSNTITHLLTRYNQEFCVMPLTNDFEANPFRFDAARCQGSQLLWHSILALSYRHLNRESGIYSEEAKTHKETALQMLRDVESATEDTNLEPTLLDAVLILMTLDFGLLILSHRWDVTLALTTRQGCVLSESTIVNLFKPICSAKPTFYSVSGCPEALFKQMVRLGSYAREFELASTMVCVNFDMNPVLEVEAAIREWKDQTYGDIYELCSSKGLPEGYSWANMMHHEDLHHCAEAWRYALLLYINRVFKWQRDMPPSPSLSFLARKALNHVTSCRRDSMVQKQLLLPVFLAGCETTDEHLRQEAKQYCTWWSNKTRYDMFSTTTELLEEVWADRSETAWWGSLIDEKSRSGSKLSKGRQYLFG